MVSRQFGELNGGDLSLLGVRLDVNARSYGMTVQLAHTRGSAQLGMFTLCQRPHVNQAWTLIQAWPSSLSVSAKFHPTLTSKEP